MNSFLYKYMKRNSRIRTPSCWFIIVEAINLTSIYLYKKILKKLLDGGVLDVSKLEDEGFEIIQ